MKKLCIFRLKKTVEDEPKPKKSRCTFEGILLSNFETYKSMVVKHFAELGFECVNAQINYVDAGCSGWLDFEETSEHMLRTAVANGQ